MKNFLRSVSLALLISVLTAGALLAADTPYWVEPCANPKTNCVAGDLDLARWALAAWEASSAGRLHFVETKNRGRALLRVRWVDPNSGLYGETVPIEVNGRRGSELFISIMETSGSDKLLRDTIVYLTCLHESGHALVAALQKGGDPLHKVTIIPRGMALGVTQQLPLDDRYTHSRQYLMTSLAVLFGGRVAAKELHAPRLQRLDTGVLEERVPIIRVIRRCRLPSHPALVKEISYGGLLRRRIGHLQP